MRTTAVRGAGWWHRAIWLSLVPGLLCLAGLVSAQAPPGTYGEARPAFIALIARVDPLDPDRYVEVPTDEQPRVVAFFRGGQPLPSSVPQVLERGDEFETARDVMVVIRYPIGDVYVDAGTRVRIGSLDVLFGRVFAKVKGFFSVENQNVVAGVEGTEFAFEVARDGSTEITVLDGAVLSSSKRLPWKPLRVTRNQAFWVTDSGMQIKVRAAPATELAQLQRWVDRADRAVAVLAPREPQAAPPPPPPTLEPQPQQSVPPSMQPVPQLLQPGPPPLQSTSPPVIVLPVPIITDRSGYCCDAAGGVYRSTASACRGTLYPYEADAYKQCRIGFCCANNRVFETTAAQCGGVFSFDRASIAESCAIKGYCCSDGVLTQTTRNQCNGQFTTDRARASQLCGGGPGYCCSGGAVLPANRAQCPANHYYTNEAAAQQACRVVQGYCCAGGKVTQTTQERCGGTFALAAADACKPVIRAPKTDTGQVGKRIPPDAARTTQKQPSEGPTTSVDTGKVVKQPPSDAAKTKVDASKVPKQPPSDAAKTKVESSKVIKKPPPSSDGPVVN